MTITAPAFDHLGVSANGRTGRLTLTNPAKLNPLSAACLSEIAAAAHWFDTETDATVVVVSGAGRAFSAGADLASFGPSSSTDERVPTLSPRDSADLGRQMAEAIESMRALAIASIRGWCIGGGLVLAAACDLRVASENARFSIPEVDLGIPLAWGGIPRLVRELGPALAKELVLTCRPFDAAEAKAAGFLNRVVTDDQLDDAVAELAAQISEKAPLAVASTKRHVNAVTDQMVGTMRSWSDADGLAYALRDPECVAARKAYLDARQK